jgi:glycosyltransferase involved in cell wall biosynthesis
VAYSLATIGPDATGGAEQVLGMLDRALTGAGHQSIVVASEHSAVSGILVGVPPREGANSYADWAAAHDAQREALARVLASFPVQVIHFHGLDFINYLPGGDLPALVTLHLPPGWYRPEVFTLRRPALHLHCVSRAQRLACPACPLLGPEIENGVPVDRFRVDEPKGRHVVALGRICPEKGFHLALDAARRAGCGLRLAGRVFRYEAHLRYFREQIAPRLDAERQFVGPVDLDRKAHLLAGARCLLVPSLAPETSSLVAMEALAAGTPVVAFRTGALPDIIEEGVTGFLVDDVESMAAAIGRAGALDPEACRRVARTRFSHDRMIARYFDRYRQLAEAAW